MKSLHMTTSALVHATIHGKATTSHLMAYFTKIETYDGIGIHSESRFNHHDGKSRPPPPPRMRNTEHSGYRPVWSVNPEVQMGPFNRKRGREEDVWLQKHQPAKKKHKPNPQ